MASTTNEGPTPLEVQVCTSAAMYDFSKSFDFTRFTPQPSNPVRTDERGCAGPGPAAPLCSDDGGIASRLHEYERKIRQDLLEQRSQRITAQAPGHKRRRGEKGEDTDQDKVKHSGLREPGGEDAQPSSPVPQPVSVSSTSLQPPPNRTPFSPRATVAPSHLAAAQPSQSPPFPPAPAKTARTLERRTAKDDGAGAAGTTTASADITVLSNDNKLLLDDIVAATNDINRVQAPTVATALIFEYPKAQRSSETSFSLCLRSTASSKRVLMDSLPPADAHKRVKNVLVVWRGHCYMLPAISGLQFVVDVTLQAEGCQVVTFNASALVLPLLALRHGDLWTRHIADVGIMAWMLDPHEAHDDYDAILQNHLHPPTPSQRPPDSATVDGCALRLNTMLPLYTALYRQLGAAGMLQPFKQVETDVCVICCKMKYNGFLVDPRIVENSALVARQTMANLRKDAATYSSNGHFNIQSVDDCRRVLYEELGLASRLTDTCHTKSGKLSTSEETLRGLSAFHPLPSIIIQHRKLGKLSQTYFEGTFGSAIQTDVGGGNTMSIHANFLQDGTDTGRLSCTEPNLQNLPRSTSDVLGCVRRAFVPLPGHILVAADYDQIELRVLAHLSQDPRLISQFCETQRGETEHDVHRRIASIVFSKEVGSITKEERTAAKRVVFGCLYGMGARALAAHLGKPMEEAMRITEQFKACFPHIDQYIAHVIKTCRKDGLVRTLSGRWRKLTEINDPNPARRSLAERQAFNTVVQGVQPTSCSRPWFECITASCNHSLLSACCAKYTTS